MQQCSCLGDEGPVHALGAVSGEGGAVLRPCDGAVPGLAGQVHQRREPGLALGHRADRGALETDDEIALPMSGLRPVDRGERPIVDSEHWLLNPRPPALRALMCASVIPTGAQR